MEKEPTIISDDSNEHMDRTEETLDFLRPDPRTFSDQYSIESINADLEQVDIWKNSKNFIHGEERSKAKLLEKTFVDGVEREDWFNEYDIYGKYPYFSALTTIPTSEVDDLFNHVDLVCVMSNICTGGKTMPFAIDLTYNVDKEKMKRKFSWVHCYGKKGGIISSLAPDNVSEFGSVVTNEDGSTETRAISVRLRRGTRMPGFSSVKYFEDKNNEWSPLIEKGRIDLMPRFVVGYSPEIAEVLAKGAPSIEYKMMDRNTEEDEALYEESEEQYEKAKNEYELANKRAKWCTLIECFRQSDDIREMMNGLTEEDVRYINGNEVLEAKKQIESMYKYFEKAFKVAQEKAENDESEAAARQYAFNDFVCKTICEQSAESYLNWRPYEYQTDKNTDGDDEQA